MDKRVVSNPKMKAEDSTHSKHLLVGYVIAHAQNEIDPRIAVPGRDTTQYLLHDDTLVQSSWNNLDYPLQIDEPDVVRSQFPLEFYDQESGSHEKYDQPMLEWANFMNDPFVFTVYFDMIGNATCICRPCQSFSTHNKYEK